MKITRYVLGAELKPSEQKRALAVFIHRYTGNHKPLWASEPWKDGLPYPLQFKDDADWLTNTSFAVTAKGDLHGSIDYCSSNPTWPNGKP